MMCVGKDTQQFLFDQRKSIVILNLTATKINKNMSEFATAIKSGKHS